MGNLLRLLSRSDSQFPEDASNDVFIDIESAEVTEAEQAHYQHAAAVLTKANGIVALISNYQGAANEIRCAISDPHDAAAQQLAWEAVLPLVDNLLETYRFGAELKTVIDSLLGALCSADKTAKEHLEQQQALFTQFALIIDFVVRFDQAKMNTPTICNDLSYFRRVQPKFRGTPKMTEVENSGLAMHFGHHTPMMKVLTESVGSFMAVHKNLPVNTTSECLAAIADICRGLVANAQMRQRLQKPEESVPLCLRVMTGVCVLYDHVHPLGVFCRNSSVNIRACIHALRNEPEFKQECESLLNVLRYSSRTLNSSTTPKAVHSMLEA